MSSAVEHGGLDGILAQKLRGLNRRRVQDRAPSERRKLGSFTVIALILNRTIGSGIFVVPRNVLLGTRSVGLSLILWAVGAILSTFGLLVWIELGLSIPRHIVPDGRIKSVPRSGGEKNYLEFMIQSPKFLATCIFGIIFIVLGNLSGNGIQFGIYVMQAAGHDEPSSSQVIGCAVGALTITCVIHVFSRRGGILLSNIFALFKVGVLCAIIVIGFAVGAGANLGQGARSESANLDVSHSFDSPSSLVANYSLSLLSIFYTFSGFEQPFYILSEVRSPRKTFPRATLIAMAIASTLFFLVNAAFMYAIPVDTEFLREGNDMAILFFRHIFGPEVAPRVMSGIIAACIFGNILVMTFTASRVKQEIAKEGILPFSLFFARGHITPDAALKRKLHERRKRRERKVRLWQSVPADSTAAITVVDEEEDDDDLALPEHTPMAALLLHWAVSIILLGVTAMLAPPVQYFALVFVYSYAIVVLIPLLTTAGLLWLRFKPGSTYVSQVQGYRPLGGPIAAIMYGATCLFLILTPFLDPGDGSPWGFKETGVKLWILPTIAVSSLMWGPAWWIGLKIEMFRRRVKLVVTRVPYIEQDDEEGEEWVQCGDLVEHYLQSREYAQRRKGRGLSDIESARAIVVG